VLAVVVSVVAVVMFVFVIVVADPLLVLCLDDDRLIHLSLVQDSSWLCQGVSLEGIDSAGWDHHGDMMDKINGEEKSLSPTIHDSNPVCTAKLMTRNFNTTRLHQLSPTAHTRATSAYLICFYNTNYNTLSFLARIHMLKISLKSRLFQKTRARLSLQSRK
jgi:hypothetical protein